MYDNSGSICGGEHEMYDGNYSMSDALEENTRDKIYTWNSDTTNGERDLVEGSNVLYFLDNG